MLKETITSPGDETTQDDTNSDDTTLDVVIDDSTTQGTAPIGTKKPPQPKFK